MSRSGIDFEGIGAVYATFKAAGSVSSVMLVSGASYVEGKAVAVEGNGILGYGNAGDPLRGKIYKYEGDHHMTVQVKGFTDMPGKAEQLPTAEDFVVVDGEGNVSTAANASTGGSQAISVDDTNDEVMVLLA